MLRYLKFVGSLLINLGAAVIGTAILDTEVRRLIPTHTVAAIVWKEIILSIVCAAFIGFFMWRTWRSSAAKWTWVPAALWFMFGYLAIARSANVWGRLSGFSSGSVLSAPDVQLSLLLQFRSFEPFPTLWEYIFHLWCITPAPSCPTAVDKLHSYANSPSPL